MMLPAKISLIALCLIGTSQLAVCQLRLESRVPSIQLSSETSPKGVHSVALKNTSAHAVLMYTSGPFSPPGSAAGSVTQGPLKSGDSIVLNPVSELLVSAAIFEDGSYEGYPEIAAKMAEEYFGHMVQFERIRTCTEGVLAGSGSDEEKFNAIHEAISKLAIDPEQDAINRLAHDFPSLAQHMSSVTSVQSRRYGAVFVGMNMAKSFALQSLKTFRDRSKGSTPEDWLQMMKRSFEPGFLLDYRAN